MKGLSPDGGLFMPEEIPQLDVSFFNDLQNLSIQEIGFEVAKLYVDREISNNDLKVIVDDAINFDAPLVELGRVPNGDKLGADIFVSYQ